MRGTRYCGGGAARGRDERGPTLHEVMEVMVWESMENIFNARLGAGCDSMKKMLLDTVVGPPEDLRGTWAAEVRPQTTDTHPHRPGLGGGGGPEERDNNQKSR